MKSLHARMPRPRVAAAGLCAVLALAVAGCGGTSQSSQAGVQVTLRDFAVDMPVTNVAKGSTRLAINNAGPSVHELEVFTLPAGVDPASVPITNSVADTDSVGMTVIDEVEDIAPSTTASLTVDLQPGRYLFVCNLPGHYQSGMHTEVNVQ